MKRMNQIVTGRINKIVFKAKTVTINKSIKKNGNTKINHEK